MPPGYLFAGFRLEPDDTLLRGATRIAISPAELAALRLLLENAGGVVTPRDLKQRIWGSVTAGGVITECIDSLRQRLAPEDCIQTVYKRGYRFTADFRSYGTDSPEILPRLAILPFTGDDGVPEYLGPAVAEETFDRLRAARPLMVSLAAAESVFALSRRGLTPLEVGRTLNADLVLSGTLRVHPFHYRLRVELFSVAQAGPLWAEDLLVERSRMAGPETELVKVLTFRLSGAGLSISASAASGEQEAQPQQRDAYEMLQHARFEWRTFERHRMQDGLRDLLRATELDPSQVAARVDLVNLCITQSLYGFMPPAAASAMVRRAAAAVADIPAQAENMLPGLGWASFHFDHNLPAALHSFGLSAHLSHDSFTTLSRSMFALSRHRFGEAIELLRAVLHIDPWSAWLHGRLGWACHLAGEAAASLETIESALLRFPEHEGVLFYAAAILAYNGQATRAIEMAGDLAQRLPYFDIAGSLHAYALARAGRSDEARSVLERLEWLSRERYVLSTFSAAAYVALGEMEMALEELRTAEKIRCPWFFQTLADPRLEPLRNHPEFQAMRRIPGSMESTADSGGS